jgi:hypothetical protein
MRHLSIVMAAAVFAAGIVLVFAGLGDAPTAGERDCGRAVLEDWSHGRLDATTYSGPCYLAALEGMPEDLRSYTTAHDDITRALQSLRPGGSHGDQEP